MSKTKLAILADTTKEILEQFAEKIIPELKAVSKRFADSIEYQATDKTLEITANKHIVTLIDGRPPTSSNPEIGPKSLQQIILEWIPTKNIVPRAGANGIVPTITQLSWAISKSIHRDGDRLYQQGGGNDIFAGIITENRLNSLVNLIGDIYFSQIKKIKTPNFA